MTPKPTPRTDSFFWILRPQPEALEFARQLERENQTFRAAQKACEYCDAPFVGRVAELERELAEHKRHAEDIYKASVELAAMLEDKLDAERALADSLADALRDIEGRACDATIMLHPDADTKGCVDDCWEWSEQALAAWKEARSGTI